MPEYKVVLPTLHADQVRAWELPGRFKAVRCGRRWGKTEWLKTVACDSVATGEFNALFTPSYKYLSEPYNGIADILGPIKERSSKTEGIIKCIGGGQMDFWTLEDDRAGRGRRYHNVFMDECAFTNPNMTDIWEQAIKPTLLDYGGRAYALSNTNGNDPDNFFYRICNDKKYGFVEFHAPSRNNPLIPLRRRGESELDWLARREAEFEAIRLNNHPLVYQQEYLAEWVDWSGIAFFSSSKLLMDGKPMPYPGKCDGIFAVIDSATKTGKDNDGTAVVWCALTNRLERGRLQVLDWDVTKIEGSLLEAWLPSVLQRGEELARQCGARNGFAGVWIEDKDSGQILLQQSIRKGLNVRSIDSKLTSAGKDQRCISISGYVHQELVKMSDVAYEKVTQYNGTTRNHLLSQITGFRVGDKQAATRADDLLDAWVYSVAISLGNSQGW